MGDLTRFDQARALELDSQSLSHLTHEELLDLIHGLESPDCDPQQFEHDHRKHLTRLELERLVTLLQWLHRKRKGDLRGNALV
jgi:hypothetical protein